MDSSFCQLAERPAQRLHDEHLTTLARAHICAGSYHQLRHLTCEVNDGCVTLGGVLRSYWLKQVAQVVAQRIPGVHGVRNEIVVQH